MYVVYVMKEQSRQVELYMFQQNGMISDIIVAVEP